MGFFTGFIAIRKKAIAKSDEEKKKKTWKEIRTEHRQVNKAVGRAASVAYSTERKKGRKPVSGIFHKEAFTNQTAGHPFQFGRN